VPPKRATSDGGTSAASAQDGGVEQLPQRPHDRVSEARRQCPLPACDLAGAEFVELARRSWSANGRRFRVLAVVPIDDEESPIVGLLQIEAA
jgi:hypothetical protein